MSDYVFAVLICRALTLSMLQSLGSEMHLQLEDTFFGGMERRPVVWRHARVDAARLKDGSSPFQSLVEI